VGTAWERREVRSAAHVAELLVGSVPAVFPRVRTIACEPVGGYERVYLGTDEGGARIEWGVAGGGAQEVAEATRCRHLQALLAQVPSFRTVRRAMVWTAAPASIP
jgi:hypothetical protein